MNNNLKRVLSWAAPACSAWFADRLAAAFARMGYAKIPEAALALSLEQERFLENLIKFSGAGAFGDRLAQQLEIQKSITGLLRSGALILPNNQ